MKVAPILVVVSAVALGVAGSGNRGEKLVPTAVLVATRFIPAGTPVEHLQWLLQPTTRALPEEAIPSAPRYMHRGRYRLPPQHLSGRVTLVDIYPDQQFEEAFAGP